MKLTVEELNSHYGPAHILFDIDLAVDAGEVVAECSGDDDTCHFHVPLGQDLLYLVAKVGHGCYCVAPHLLL